MTFQAIYRTEAGRGCTFHSLVGASGEPEAYCCILDGSSQRLPQNVLASTRLIQISLSPRQLRTQLRRQAKNLEQKLQLIDALDLCRVPITKEFRTARAFVLAPESARSSHAWTLAADLWKHVTQSENVRVVTQPDYDQMEFAHHWVGLLDCPSFHTKHVPSAVATVDTYTSVLGTLLPARDAPTISVIGVGELGGRICDAFLNAGNPVIAFDIDPRRCEPFANRKGFSAAPSVRDALTSGAAATVFCARANSLSVSVARILARTGGTLCVGGPEAGLDRNAQALRVLRDGRIHFIPSVLCGSLGLAANLEEVLGVHVDLERARLRLADHVAAVIREMHLRNELFDESWVSYTQSIMGAAHLEFQEHGSSRADDLE
ncbi:MAG TPA: NAD(P)-binding domain-containing protein [Thermoanaerobaculia bacterium]|nr:NAD(P)-binding domain-containing protein [Thermoanaerobaculia bacterium]